MSTKKEKKKKKRKKRERLPSKKVLNSDNEHCQISHKRIG